MRSSRSVSPESSHRITVDCLARGRGRKEAPKSSVARPYVSLTMIHDHAEARMARDQPAFPQL